ncbi:dynamin family protein [Krasilnikovia cinnamomea]|uniref:Dynamin family protein n=1 Tax=Krasilnikovia cinnamomea TaxID=349313 RepID=A0A4Q7ZSH8_9ACTN|nr:dynamin family protein [Krasilnikovia cinnamomea]RZU54147.1 dynamin family protein [Krasilnikovia cinnamomea]
MRPVVARIARLCDDIGPLLAADGQDTVAAVRAGLSEPLRLAVVGRVKAGKSTLVNALVKRRIAPTAVGECTRTVTWYRYGAPERAEVELRDGSRRDLPWRGGRLPDSLGVPAEQVARVVVYLQAAALRDQTVIDTPGLATLTSANEAATRAEVFGAGAAPDDAEQVSRYAAGQAEALLFVFREAERKDEIEFLTQFRAATGEIGASAVNAVGVLSQSDQFTGTDPFEVADGRAAQLAAARAADVSAVVAASGLLAQAARTGRLGEGEARLLAGIADVPESLLRLRRTRPLPGTDPAELDRLFGLLGVHGVHQGRHRSARGAHELVQWLESVSGVAKVEDLVRRSLLSRAHALKAMRALRVLTDAANRTGLDTGAALGLIEQARLDPALHPVRELRALRHLVAEAPVSPLRAELERVSADTTDQVRVGLPASATPDDVATAARRCAAAAQEQAAFAPMPAEAEAGRVLARSYQLIAQRARP